MSVCAKPQITSENEFDFVKGDMFSKQLTSFGTPGLWSIINGALPNGLVLSETGLLSGVSTEFGDFTFTVKVKNDCGEATQQITLYICAKPVITSGFVVNFLLDEEDLIQLTHDGTEGTWSIISGVLPNGVTFDSNGVIRGTATESGHFLIKIKIENPCGENIQDIDIFVCAFANITSSHYDLVMGEPVSEQLQFTGSRPGVFSISNGALPEGLTLSSNGLISGTPTEYGDFNVTVKVENPCGEKEKQITIFVCGSPDVTTENIDSFVFGEEGSVQLELYGTEGTWSMINGVLPNGLTLNSNGLISGTPTESGNFTFTVKVENSCGEATKVVNLFVCVLPVITSSPNWGFVMNEEIHPSYVSFSGSQPGIFSIIDGALPNGLELNSETGIITGIPTEYGNFNITVKVENHCGEATQAVSIFVCGSPEITTTDIEFIMNESGSEQLEIDGTPGTWSVAYTSAYNLPAGLYLNSETGVISGTPTQFGDFAVTIRVVNGCGEDEKVINIFVCGKPEITLPVPEDGSNMKFIMGEEDYSAILEYYGTEGGTWSIVEGVLPDGLTLDPETGVIGGIPTEAGTFTFKVKIENYCGEAEEVINLFVCEIAEIEIPDPEDLTFETGEEVFIQLNASGTPGSWSISPLSQDNLPAGLFLNSETGVISGIVNEFGYFNVTLQLNSPCCEITQEITIFICGEPKITTDEQLYFVMGEDGSAQLKFKGTN